MAAQPNFGQIGHDVLRRLRQAWVGLNDLYLGIDTRHPSGKSGTAAAEDGPPRTRASVGPRTPSDSHAYESIDYSVIRKIARRLAPSTEEVVYDIGCGKGRIVCVLARRRLGGVVGVDISEGLCRTARGNAERLRGRRTEIEIRCADAGATSLDGGTLYWLFNPFGPRTMDRFLDNLERSLEDDPRAIGIVYYIPRHEDVFAKRAWLTKTDEFLTLVGRNRVTVWANRPS